ncbi:MAG: ribosome maturation factor RimP [Actinomycetota bacterium]
MEGREAIEREVEERLADAMPEVDLLEVAIVGTRGGGTLRAVIDHPRGVDHDLCAAVTRVLGEAGMLDRFSVEVSSPGPEPPLRTTEHFRRALGSRVQLRIETEDGAQATRTGSLLAADDATLSLATAQGVLQVARSAVRRARALEPVPTPRSET